MVPCLESSRPFLIGIGGGAASGKSDACRRILEKLSIKGNGDKAFVLSISSFYRQLKNEELMLAQIGMLDLDHPRMINFDELLETLIRVKKRQHVRLNLYDPSAYSKQPDVLEIPQDVDIVIVEGILTFYQKKIREMFNMKIFVEDDADVRLSRIVLRDVCKRNRTLNSVIENYFNFVKPAFEEFCLPTKKYSDVILPRVLENVIGLDLITHHILQMLTEFTKTHENINYINNSVSLPVSIRPH